MKPFTCAFANQKPGTGKSTSAMILAAECHRLGMDTLLVDNDKAGTCLRWADVAGGAPFAIVGMPTRQIARELPDMLRRTRHQAVIVDTRQMEDSAPETRAALTAVQDWIVPVTPGGLEMDRTVTIFDAFDEIDPGHIKNRHILFSRSNTRQPTKTGPDADWRDLINKQDDWDVQVFPDQVPHDDTLFRQNYGEIPDGRLTAYNTLARYLAADDREAFLRAWRGTFEPTRVPLGVFSATDDQLYAMHDAEEAAIKAATNTAARRRAERKRAHIFGEIQRRDL